MYSGVIGVTDHDSGVFFATRGGHCTQTGKKNYRKIPFFPKIACFWHSVRERFSSKILGMVIGTSLDSPNLVLQKLT